MLLCWELQNAPREYPGALCVFVFLWYPLRRSAGDPWEMCRSETPPKNTCRAPVNKKETMNMIMLCRRPEFGVQRASSVCYSIIVVVFGGYSASRVQAARENRGFFKLGALF